MSSPLTMKEAVFDALKSMVGSLTAEQYMEALRLTVGLAEHFGQKFELNIEAASSRFAYTNAPDDEMLTSTEKLRESIFAFTMRNLDQSIPQDVVDANIALREYAQEAVDALSRRDMLAATSKLTGRIEALNSSRVERDIDNVNFATVARRIGPYLMLFFRFTVSSIVPYLAFKYVALWIPLVNAVNLPSEPPFASYMNDWLLYITFGGNYVRAARTRNTSGIVLYRGDSFFRGTERIINYPLGFLLGIVHKNYFTSSNGIYSFMMTLLARGVAVGSVMASTAADYRNIPAAITQTATVYIGSLLIKTVYDVWRARSGNNAMASVNREKAAQEARELLQLIGPEIDLLPTRTPPITAEIIEEIVEREEEGPELPSLRRRGRKPLVYESSLLTEGRRTRGSKKDN